MKLKISFTSYANPLISQYMPNYISAE
jgi:hypothetical protein